MKNIVKVLVFIIFLFFVNLFFYFFSDDYKFFLKKIKNKQEVVYLEEKNIDDSFMMGSELGEEEEEENIDVQVEQEIQKIPDAVTPKKTILGKNYMKILETLSDYDLRFIELNSNLFDITDEYPDYYYEYYSRDVILYLFASKKYSEVYDVFKVLEYELPFTLNELNNLGDQSFYINLKDDIDDKFVRIVISNNGIVIGLKIKKDEYNNVKEKLSQL